MNSEWKKLGERPYKAGYRSMVEKTFVTPDGLERKYDIVDGGNTVVVFALTHDLDVIVVETFRPGPEKVLLEMPGGFINKDEDPEKAARRELLEETGYEPTALAEVTSEWYGAYSNTRKYTYLALGCEKKCEATPDEGEFVEVKEISLEKFIDNMASGEMTDASQARAGLEFLKMHVAHIKEARKKS